MTNVMNLLQRYSGGTQENTPASVHDDFAQVGQEAPSDHLASGLNEAFRSEQTPPFETMVARLFGASNPEQKAGILNQLLQSVAPSILGSGLLGGLSKYLGPAGSINSISPQQAEQVPPEQVQDLAKNAKQQDPTIVDRASSFYAQHPTLVQALGAGALALIMSHMSNRQS